MMGLNQTRGPRPAKLGNVIAGLVLFALGFGTVAGFIKYYTNEPPSCAAMSFGALAEWSTEWNRLTPKLSGGD